METKDNKMQDLKYISKVMTLNIDIMIERNDKKITSALNGVNRENNVLACTWMNVLQMSLGTF